MDQRIKTKQELLRRIQRPDVSFVEERFVSSEKALTDTVRQYQRLIRSGRSLSLVALETKE